MRIDGLGEDEAVGRGWIEESFDFGYDTDLTNLGDHEFVTQVAAEFW